LKQGKRTALVAALEGDAEANELLPRVLGVADAKDTDVDALIARMVASGGGVLAFVESLRLMVTAGLAVRLGVAK